MQMIRKERLGLASLAGLGFVLTAMLVGVVQTVEAKEYPAWEEVTKGSTTLPGLFPLHYNEKDQQLFLEISKSNYDTEFILPISIASGAGRLYLGGDTLNFGDQWLVSFRRSADRIHLVRRNIKFKASAGSPQADAVKTSYNDSIIRALPIKSEKSGGSSVLIDAADLFMVDLAGIGVNPDRARSTWFKVKAYPENIEIQVAAVFASSNKYTTVFGSDSAVPDPRGTQIVLHYSLSKLPSNGYKPRLADDRIGYFLSTVNDFSKDVDESAKVRYINRWHLEKENASAELSAPKQPIIFWIEKSVPRTYRPYVREGILEWNKAFEKVGFIDAIQCRDQQSSDDFEPEDIRYNTFRWITTASSFAMGPSRTNPKTGQIIDADIVFDESMVRYHRQDYVKNVGIPQGLELLARGERQAFMKLFAAEVPEIEGRQAEYDEMLKLYKELIAEHPQHSLNQQFPRQPTWVHSTGGCNCCMMGPGIQRQLGLMSSVMAINGLAPGGKVPEEFIGQAIKEVVMHEIGHTLGLRHNFKASTMLSLEEINNPEITRKKGMIGSVMDYAPANFALDPSKQGDYFTTTIGPYDYWAIEYAYKPISGSEEEELNKIAKKAPEHDLIYATDEDMAGNPDPRINLFDLGDPLDYSEQRIAFMKKSIDGLVDRVVEEGDGYQRARETFTLLLGEISLATQLAAQYAGGAYTARDHKGDPNERPAMQPIPLEKHQQALDLLSREIFADSAFNFSPELLRKLAPEHLTDGYESTPNYLYPINDRVLSIQRMALTSLLHDQTLKRVQEIELHAEKDQKVLTLPVIFDSLTTAIWSEVPTEINPNEPIEISTLRRNLQRAYLTQLSGIALGTTAAPADAKSLARLHLQDLFDRLDGLEEANAKLSPYSKAHLRETRDQIEKVLNAEISSARP
ncbi:zinc-dependent metalloprotease [uncultured Rubinisphaera sp.]|uniref:zinc-dependent metalloprotease n=1 Tax=uncultured Rubinisphaera sp. TaxID=1678686 RepID=UPI0030D911A7